MTRPMTRSFLPALAALAFFTSVACARPDVIVLPPDGGGAITIDGNRVEIPPGATHAVRTPEFFVAQPGAPVPAGWKALPSGGRVHGVSAPAGATHYRTGIAFRSGAVNRGFIGTIDAMRGPQQAPPQDPATKTTTPTSTTSTTATSDACDASKPCAPGFVCENGVCVPTTSATSDAACDASKPCAPGFVCEDGVCVPVTTTTTSDAECDTSKPCAPGYVCEGGVCVPDRPLGDPRDLMPAPPPPVAPPPDVAPAPRNDDPRAGSLDEAVRRARAEKKVILVDFYATWCGPCKRVASESLPSLLADSWVRQNAIVVKIDIDRHPDLAQRFRVSGIPDLRVLRVSQSGLEAAGAATGFRSASQLRSMLQAAR